MHPCFTNHRHIDSQYLMTFPSSLYKWSKIKVTRVNDKGAKLFRIKKHGQSSCCLQLLWSKRKRFYSNITLWCNEAKYWMCINYKLLHIFTSIICIINLTIKLLPRNFSPLSTFFTFYPELEMPKNLRHFEVLHILYMVQYTECMDFQVHCKSTWNCKSAKITSFIHFIESSDFFGVEKRTIIV